MSRGQRIGALAVAAAIAVAAFVVLGPTGSDQAPSQSQTAAEAPQGGDASPQAAGTAAEAAPQYTTLRLRDGEPVGGVEEISVESGEPVRLEVRSNQPAELHIHGYDEYVDVQPGEPTRTRFPADLEGVYEIEDHGTGALVAELRVSP